MPGMAWRCKHRRQEQPGPNLASSQRGRGAPLFVGHLSPGSSVGVLPVHPYSLANCSWQRLLSPERKERHGVFSRLPRGTKLRGSGLLATHSHHHFGCRRNRDYHGWQFMPLPLGSAASSYKPGKPPQSLLSHAQASWGLGPQPGSVSLPASRLPSSPQSPSQHTFRFQKGQIFL